MLWWCSMIERVAGCGSNWEKIVTALVILDGNWCCFRRSGGQAMVEGCRGRSFEARQSSVRRRLLPTCVMCLINLLDPTTQEASKIVKLAGAAMGNTNPIRRKGFKWKFRSKNPLEPFSSEGPKRAPKGGMKKKGKYRDDDQTNSNGLDLLAFLEQAQHILKYNHNICTTLAIEIGANKKNSMSNEKVVLVTGCAKGGIGYEYCKAFAEKNCHVFASDIPQRMQDLEDLHSEKIETLELDVSSDESVTRAINSVMSRRGRIDILINNAGIGGTGPLAELPLDIIRRTYEINTLGQLRMIQQVVPYMAVQRNGSIVNIGSVVGRVPTPWAGAYCTSKAAVHAISDTLRVELRPFEIDVILVVPGAIKSNLGSNNIERSKDYDWKVYKDFKESIIERARASQVGKSTDATLFARHVASKVLSPKPPKQIVFGHMTGLFTFLSWSPLWVRDLFFTNRFKLNKKIL
ncbi:NADPH-dependent 1-acyldihydroxyacetone phosphate reductase-like [Olea europaea subsp. europaea]|uniref:NADPH-dependent 1-acyldihydroxyacetone phosphate reductase-like n=1 Tax=Olea europaea subsp. europaea TaxID=158383 RepID=A0A8S0TC08_OLEEU|nr:NADPH-dependent 1-acyldihydroxyacetone phosphate reductase-like [Olea europaea subsp. europaea]